MREIDKDTLELMRKVVEVPPLLQETYIQKTYAVQVVTPMFGGGVNAGENDATKLIRETSIRGMLRFWFRATVGADCKTPEELFDKESEIFGTTDAPSRLKIRVSNVQAQKPQAYGELSPNMSFALGYALFPFAPNPKTNTSEKSGRRSTFNLTLSYPEEYEQEIETTLWAWLNFGGIGARTRRGCGALFCKEFAPRLEENNVVWRQNFVSSTLENSRGTVRQWSTLGEAFLHAKTADPQTAWTFAVDDYRYFRQGLDFARNRGQNGSRPGRSFWPEPDALRRITESNAPQHKPYTDRPITFPRAELGAPVNFHFIGVGEPKVNAVCPVGYERASSPIIIKPLVFDDGETAASCVVFLNGPRVEKVKVVYGNKTRECGVVDINNATYKNSPLKGLSTSGSALKGFKQYVRNNGYKAIQ